MPNKLDLAFAAILGVVCAMLGVTVLLQNGWLHFYQVFSPESVYWGCGRGFGNSLDRPQALTDFLTFATLSFDCASLASVPPPGPMGFFAHGQLYLSGAAALLWRVLGVSYAALWPLVALLTAAYASGCYVLLRQFFGRWRAAVGGLILALSPVALTMVISIRDYAKAPFFVWTVALLIIAMRSDSWRRALAWSLLAGLVTGIGYGFRSDVVILLPLGVLTILIGVGLRHWWIGAASAATFVIVAIVAAAPIWVGATASGSGFLVMQGATDPFVQFLEVSPAPYSLGQHYSDELTLSSIAAEMRAADPDYDAHEAQPIHGLTQAVTRSNAYVAPWISLFAGDLATRSLKAAAWVLGYPALVTPAHAALDPAGTTRQGPTVTHLADWLYNLLGQPWMPILGIVGIAAFFWRETVRSGRQAVALLVLLGGLLAYPVIQPSIRHMFHLEILWVAAVLALVTAPFEARALASVVARFAAGLVLFGVVVGGAWFGLLAYQDRALQTAVDELVALPRAPMQTRMAVTARGTTRVEVAVPDEDRPATEGPGDSMINVIWPPAVEWAVRASGERVVASFSGECPTARSTLSLVYAKTDAWQPMDSHVDVGTVAGKQTVFVFPAIYRPTQHFAAIELPTGLADCLTGVERTVGRPRLPLIFSAVLEPGWRERPLHQGFGGFSPSGQP